MAGLVELGNKFPCTTEGVEVLPTDQTSKMYSGDILEVWIEADRDITLSEAFNCLWDVLRMKEQYPQFVLHYFKVETRKITVQYSVAPTGAEASPWLVALVIAIGIVAIIGLLVTAAVLKWTRGYVWYPVGWAAVTAKDVLTNHGISGVKIYVDGGSVGTTDGYTVNKKLRTGSHVFSADAIEGYQDPYPVTATINLNQTTPVTIYFRPTGSPEPTTGWVAITTAPSGAAIAVDGSSVGVSPVSLELSIGDHDVAFGNLEGYYTPAGQVFTIQPGVRTPVNVVYQLIEKPWWEDILPTVKWILIGGAAVVGTAILLPPLIRTISERRIKE